MIRAMCCKRNYCSVSEKLYTLFFFVFSLFKIQKNICVINPNWNDTIRNLFLFCCCCFIVILHYFSLFSFSFTNRHWCVWTHTNTIIHQKIQKLFARFCCCSCFRSLFLFYYIRSVVITQQFTYHLITRKIQHHFSFAFFFVAVAAAVAVVDFGTIISVIVVERFFFMSTSTTLSMCCFAYALLIASP